MMLPSSPPLYWLSSSLETSHAGARGPCSRVWVRSAKHRLLYCHTGLHAMWSSVSGCRHARRRALQFYSHPWHLEYTRKWVRALRVAEEAGWGSSGPHLLPDLDSHFSTLHAYELNAAYARCSYHMRIGASKWTHDPTLCVCVCVCERVLVLICSFCVRRMRSRARIPIWVFRSHVCACVLVSPRASTRKRCAPPAEPI